MKKIIILALFIICTYATKAQVGIGTSSPDTNSILDLNSDNKGLLLPRVVLNATTDPSPLLSHTAGMTIYNTVTNTSTSNPVYPGEYYNNGTQWIRKTGSNESRFLVGGDINDAITSNFTLSTANTGASTIQGDLVTYDFTLSQPSIVHFNANISARFNNNSGGLITDGSARHAKLQFYFSSAPSGVSINRGFGGSSIVYTNSNASSIVGHYFINPHAMLSLPAGTYRVLIEAVASSTLGYTLTLGETRDFIQILATPTY